MTLVRFNPWRDASSLQNRINHVFDNAFLRPERSDNELALSNWRPAVDIFDREDRVVIKAELPGVEKEDINVDLKDRVLTLKGQRSFENEVKEENVYRRERAHGSFQRAFTLPADLKAAMINADYKDGVLTIEIPKPEKAQPKQITIN
jgi:HSP20 family protein